MLALSLVAVSATVTCHMHSSDASILCQTHPNKGEPVKIHLPKTKEKKTAFYDKGLLCREKACRYCLDQDETFKPCNKEYATKFDLSISVPENGMRKHTAIFFALLALSPPLLALRMLRRRDAPYSGTFGASQTSKTNEQHQPGTILSFVIQMLGFASRSWFPWVAALGTALNLFTLVFTAATVVLFLAAVLARPKNWAYAAVANSLGATLGSAALLALVGSQGEGLIETNFPSVVASPAWSKMMFFMSKYGIVGMIGVSALPLILHPIIAFGLVTGMSSLQILLIIFIGRTIKYLVMAKVATSAPAALRFFGIKSSLVSLARDGVADKRS